MPGGGAGELPGAEHETPEAAPGETPEAAPSPAGRVRRTKPGRVDVEEAKRQRKAAATAQAKKKKKKATKDSSQEGQEDNHPMMQHLEGLAAGAARATEQARRQGMNVMPPITAVGDGPFPGFPAGSKLQQQYEKFHEHWSSFK